MKLWFVPFFAAVTLGSLACHPDVPKTSESPDDLSVEFTQIASGHSLVRPLDDRVYSAVIWDAEGLRKFREKYSIQPEPPDLSLDENHVFLVGFSDTRVSVICDGVSFQRHSGRGAYYMDLCDGDIECIKRTSRGEPTLKFSSWVIVSIDRPEAISHIQVREGVVGRLCEQFGNSPTDTARQGN
jgi:hypothetical protein